jgi:hypothetical protein
MHQVKWTLAQERTRKDELERCNSDVFTDGLVVLMFLDLCKAEFLWLGQLAAIALAQSLPTTFFLRVELFKIWNLQTDDIQYGITVERFAERCQELSPPYVLAQWQQSNTNTSRTFRALLSVFFCETLGTWSTRLKYIYVLLENYPFCWLLLAVQPREGLD